MGYSPQGHRVGLKTLSMRIHNVMVLGAGAYGRRWSQCPYKREPQSTRAPSAREDTARRLLSTSQEESSRQTLHLPAPCHSLIYHLYLPILKPDLSRPSAFPLFLSINLLSAPVAYMPHPEDGAEIWGWSQAAKPNLRWDTAPSAVSSRGLLSRFLSGSLCGDLLFPGC